MVRLTLPFFINCQKGAAFVFHFVEHKSSATNNKVCIQSIKSLGIIVCVLLMIHLDYKLHFCFLKRLLQQKGHKRIEQRIQEAAKSQVDKAHQTRA